MQLNSIGNPFSSIDKYFKMKLKTSRFYIPSTEVVLTIILLKSFQLKYKMSLIKLNLNVTPGNPGKLIVMTKK